MGRIRRQRVAEALRDELGRLLQMELKDPRVGLASIVQVEVSQDLRHARVYVSVYGSEEEQRQAMQALNGAKGWLRGEVGRRLGLRYAPELTFVADSSIRHGARISELLRSLKEE
ncbi:MAG: 30S ribosome-binding factor RbfA [Thermaerobacter sp.]|nr:30S ribosome-binding factor RbfA [Bacillota bacterium]REJ38203.1 MAG: 30S ribosome-binding factor RbfA [Bacillota bacterium]